MHTILFSESFSFCPRNDLERLQPVSQMLLEIIVAGSNVLPLRRIQRVDMGYDEDAKDKIRIFVEETTVANGHEPDYEASVLDGDFAETFRRLQHSCVNEFRVGIRDNPFLRYWMEQEATAFAVVRIDFDTPEEKDYDVLDSIVSHLRPRTTEEVEFYESSWHVNGNNSERLKLLARDSFINNLETCRLWVSGDAFPPSAFFFDEPGYPNYELSCTESNVEDGTDGFIESFIHDGCANRRLESVCISLDYFEERPSFATKHLNKPTEVDMPLPKVDLIAWLIPYVQRVSKCEMHSFMNKMQWKRMEIYKWSIDYDHGFGRITTHILQCRVKSA